MAPGKLIPRTSKINIVYVVWDLIVNWIYNLIFIYYLPTEEKAEKSPCDAENVCANPFTRQTKEQQLHAL